MRSWLIVISLWFISEASSYYCVLSLTLPSESSLASHRSGLKAFDGMGYRVQLNVRNLPPRTIRFRSER